MNGKLLLSTFGAGLLFGMGLTISQMVNPAKVISFLDISGNWDPSLAFVMASALMVTMIGYRFVLKKPAPLFAGKFRLPTRTDIDAPLVIGAVLFGMGWGLAGLCPGPAIANLSFAGKNGFIFLLSMLAGMAVYRLMRRGKTLKGDGGSGGT